MSTYVRMCQRANKTTLSKFLDPPLKLQLFKTVGRAEQVGMVAALVDLTTLCNSHADCLASERSTFQKM